MKSFFQHYPGLIIAIIMSGLVSGCALYPFKTESLIDPSRKVTKSQLQQEVITTKASLEADRLALELKAKSFAERAQVAYDDIASKETVVVTALQSLDKVLVATGVPGAALASTVGSLLLGGLFYDTKRKDRVIEKKDDSIRAQGGDPNVPPVV